MLGTLLKKAIFFMDLILAVVFIYSLCFLSKNSLCYRQGELKNVGSYDFTISACDSIFPKTNYFVHKGHLTSAYLYKYRD